MKLRLRRDKSLKCKKICVIRGNKKVIYLFVKFVTKVKVTLSENKRQ